MKTIITIAVASLFTASAGAADVYHGLDEGNSDLSPRSFESHAIMGIQPSVGDSVDRYHGFADGNPDLFQPVGPIEKEAGRASDEERPIYVGPGRTL